MLSSGGLKPWSGQKIVPPVWRDGAHLAMPLPGLLGQGGVGDVAYPRTLRVRVLLVSRIVCCLEGAVWCSSTKEGQKEREKSIKK